MSEEEENLSKDHKKMNVPFDYIERYLDVEELELKEIKPDEGLIIFESGVALSISDPYSCTWDITTME